MMFLAHTWYEEWEEVFGAEGKEDSFIQFSYQWA